MILLIRTSQILFITLFVSLSYCIYADILKKVEFTEVELKQLSGHYASVFGYLHLIRKGKRITTIAKGKRVTLTKKSDGHIYPVYKLLGLIPIAMGDSSFTLKQLKGKQVVVLHERDKKGKNTQKLVAEKFTPVPINSIWKKRLGNYRVSIEKGTSKISHLKLTLKNNILAVVFNKNSRSYPVIPVSRFTLYLPGTETFSNKRIQLIINKDKSQLIFGKNLMTLHKTI